MLDGLTEKETIENSGRAASLQTGKEAAAAATMVDENKLLRVIRRMFTGSVKEVLGELLQNAQRAGAKNVLITTESDKLIIADDGTGLIGNGAEKFSSLMKIAESSYARAEVLDQDPCGVGLFSLFALEEVSKVVLTSNGFALTIDTNRLWNEDGYWQAWKSRVCEVEAGTTASGGLKLEITATAELIKKVTDNLNSGNHAYNTFYNDFEYKSAVSGYVGVMEIVLNGELLDNTCEFAKKMDEIILETTYQGNLLVIGVDGYAHRNIVNWYGQLIKAEDSHLRFYLEVRQGRPLNPMSPSRRGIIDDAEFRALKIFLRDTFRNYILTTPKEQLSTLVISTAYAADKTWANQFCPYFTATRWKHDTMHGNFENWAGDFHDKCVLAYADNPLLMEESVALAERDKDSGELSTSEVIDYGAQTFVPVIERILGKSVYEVSSGNKNRLNVQQLWWKPGKDLENFFVEAGEFALCDTKIETVPEEGWHTIDAEAIVFAFENSENWDIQSVENLIVGVQNDIRAKIEFLDSDAWCIWSYENDDADSETMETDYRKSLEAAKAGLFKDCLPDDCLELWRLMQYFPLESGERIASIEFVYPENITNYHPIGLRLKTNSPRTMEKQFLSNAEAGLRA